MLSDCRCILIPTSDVYATTDVSILIGQNVLENVSSSTSWSFVLRRLGGSPVSEAVCFSASQSQSNLEGVAL